MRAAVRARFERLSCALLALFALECGAARWQAGRERPACWSRQHHLHGSLALRGGGRAPAANALGGERAQVAAQAGITAMDGDSEPLPQRPRRAFGVKAKEGAQRSALGAAAGSDGDAGAGAAAAAGGTAARAEGVCAHGGHTSVGIADGCAYDQAIQYVGEGGERPLVEGETRKYEYLDHTADVQFHSWGETLEEAFEQMVVCMFSYITDLHTVETTGSNTVEVSGHDMESLLYNYMDEFLFQFCTEGFVARRVDIVSFDRESFSISAKGYGEKFQVCHLEHDAHLRTYVRMSVPRRHSLVYHPFSIASTQRLWHALLPRLEQQSIVFH
jgi:SHS2 domain-containing protein